MDNTKGKLAIIISGTEHVHHICGIIEAAFSDGREISLFITDKGTLLTENGEFVSAVKKNKVAAVSVCEHSCIENGVASRIDGFRYGSQFDNAKMVSGLDGNDRALIF